MLARRQIIVYSPIAHTHPVLQQVEIDGGFDTRKEFDESMIERCDDFLILTVEGWQESVGLNAELAFARTLEKRVAYVLPKHDYKITQRAP